MNGNYDWHYEFRKRLHQKYFAKYIKIYSSGIEAASSRGTREIQRRARSRAARETAHLKTKTPANSDFRTSQNKLLSPFVNFIK
jgi:hypothetical protein